MADTAIDIGRVEAAGQEPWAGAPVADLQGLTYHYPDGGRPALVDIDLALRPGLTVVTGDSGSGKSSLLRVLNGLVPHFHGGRIRGAAVVGGMPVLRTPTRRLAREVGFVFQDPEAQFVYGTVDREVALGPENLGLPRGRIADRVAEALDAVGIEHLRHRDIATLSGGERQRVALASALAMRPQILALDEPTSQLDSGGADALIAACIQLSRSGGAIAIAEHRLDRLLPEADHVALLQRGRLIATGGPAEVAPALPHPPQVVDLGRRLGWRPLPLSVDEARRLAPPLAHPPVPAPRMAGDAAWEAGDLKLSHGGHQVLEGANLAGLAGEVVVLMGDNGSGKTTLLRAIAGLHRPAAGTVERHLAPGQRVAYLPQNPTALLHRPTLRAEIDLTLKRGPSPGAESADRILAELGLSGLADRYPRDLSGGERERSALAAILAGRPGIALLDEPTRGMDGAARIALAAVIRRLRTEGSAIVVATHDSELAADVADRIIRIDGGVARDLGPPVEALKAGRPGATQMARLYPGGPVTVRGVLACL